MATEERPEPRLKLVRVLPNILGNRMMSGALRATLHRIDGVTPTCTLVNPEDYAIHRGHRAYACPLAGTRRVLPDERQGT